MDETRIRQVLADPDASADQLGRALASIDLLHLQRVVEGHTLTHGYYQRQGRTKSARRVGAALVEAETRYEQACRLVYDLRQRLQEAERREALIAADPPPAGLFIKGGTLVASAGDGEGTTVEFQLDAGEFEYLAAACQRAADRLRDQDHDHHDFREAVRVEARAG